MAAQPQLLSVDGYHQMIDDGTLLEGSRVELIEGVLVDMSPQSKEHMAVVTRLLRLLVLSLGPEWCVRPGGPLTLARSEPEPDVAVALQAEVDRARRHPRTAALVVEVARSSLALDRAMIPIYAEAGVTEYWIVDVDGRRIEVYREPDGATYRRCEVVDEGGEVRPVAFAGVVVRVADLMLPRAT